MGLLPMAFHNAVFIHTTMYLVLFFLLQVAPDLEKSKEELKRITNPILRHGGADNISYLATLDGFDWTVILL